GAVPGGAVLPHAATRKAVTRRRFIHAAYADDISVPSRRQIPVRSGSAGLEGSPSERGAGGSLPSVTARRSGSAGRAGSPSGRGAGVLEHDGARLAATYLAAGRPVRFQ